MKSIVTVSSKGRFTLPVEVRRRMNLRKGDRLEVSFEEDQQRISIIRVATLADLSARVSSYAKRRMEPVTDVDAYHQAHRTEEHPR